MPFVWFNNSQLFTQWALSRQLTPLMSSGVKVAAPVSTEGHAACKVDDGWYVYPTPTTTLSILVKN